MKRDLNHYATFAALAQTGSFAKAAARLGLPPSTVTNHIARLEKTLGIQLVIRTTRKNRLTDAGRRFAVEAQRIVEVADRAAACIDDEKAKPAGDLRISLPHTFAADLLGPIIGEFSALYPAINIELVVSNQRVDLIDGGFDLALRVGPMADSELSQRLLGTAPGLLVASPAYLDSHGRPERPYDLTVHRLLGHRRNEVLTLNSQTGPVEVNFGSQIAANDPRVLLSMALSGAGIAISPMFLAQPHLASGRLMAVLPDLKPEAVPMSMVYHGSAARNPRIAAFASFVEPRIRARIAS